jgi:hypothetical protein
VLEDGTRDSSAAAEEHTWLPPLKNLMSTSGHCNDLLFEGHMMDADALEDPETLSLTAVCILHLAYGVGPIGGQGHPLVAFLPKVHAMSSP